MSNPDLIREFVDKMHFITTPAASILLNKSQSYASAVLEVMTKQNRSRHTKLKKFQYRDTFNVYTDKKSKKASTHDIYVVEAAARLYRNSGIFPTITNDRHADFYSGGIFYEIDMGTEGYNGTRQIKGKLQHYKDGVQVVFLCKARFGNDEKRCEQILDWVDQYRKEHNCHLSVYVLPLIPYIVGQQNRPWSRKKNGQLVKDLQI